MDRFNRTVGELTELLAVKDKAGCECPLNFRSAKVA